MLEDSLQGKASPAKWWVSVSAWQNQGRHRKLKIAKCCDWLVELPHITLLRALFTESKGRTAHGKHYIESDISQYQRIADSRYCRQSFWHFIAERKQDLKKEDERRMLISQNGWDDRMNKPVLTVEKNGQKRQMKPHPHPKAIVRHLEKPSWFETWDGRKIRGHGFGMLCGCTKASWSAKLRKLRIFADLFGTSLPFHGSPKN